MERMMLLTNYQGAAEILLDWIMAEVSRRSALVIGIKNYL